MKLLSHLYQTFNGDDRMDGCDTGRETTQCQSWDWAGVVQLFSFYVLSQVLFIYIDSIGRCGGGRWQDSACSPQLCIYPNNCLWASFPFQPSTCLESKHQYHTIYVTARQVLTLEKLCLFNLLFRNLHEHLCVKYCTY